MQIVLKTHLLTIEERYFTAKIETINRKRFRKNGKHHLNIRIS